MPRYTSKIIKGGALLEESRRLVDAWDKKKSPAANLDDLRARNLLGKRSRKRVSDSLVILRQRLIDPGPTVLHALRGLVHDGEAFREACYFEAARNDDLLAFATATVLWDMRSYGWAKVTVRDLEKALLRDPSLGSVAAWGETTRTRVIHGLLSALRDFGVLEGRAIKHLHTPHLSFGGFVYALGRLRELGESSHAIVNSKVWRWWLLDAAQVRAHLLEADRAGLLRYSDAGSTVRIDWRVDGLEAMIDGLA